MSKTVDLNVDSVGLLLAMDIYGKEAVIEYGEWLVPGIIRIPAEDESTFNELLREKEVENELNMKRWCKHEHLIDKDEKHLLCPNCNKQFLKGQYYNK